jgi:hypothetical protein
MYKPRTGLEDMKARSLKLALILTAAASGGALAPTTAHAQDLSGLVQQNMAFDQQMNAMLQNQVRQNQMAQQQLVQSYIQQRGPQLRAEYQQYIATTGMQIPFEQFVQYHIATAGGTNPGPALQQQQNNFRALQDANRTVQQGFDSYNQGYWNNQQTMNNVYSRQSDMMRGNGHYVNPQTGETQTLPTGQGQGYYQGEGGQNTYYQNGVGQYHQVNPQGYMQELDEYDPYSD